jgi:hypothetical protein
MIKFQNTTHGNTKLSYSQTIENNSNYTSQKLGVQQTLEKIMIQFVSFINATPWVSDLAVANLPALRKYN